MTDPHTPPLYTAVSLPALMIDGQMVNGPAVQWYVIARPVALSVDGMIAFEEELVEAMGDGEECASELAENTREVVREAFTADEVEALRAYLDEAHGVALYSAPLSLPVSPLPDGDVRETGRTWAGRARQSNELAGMVWLHKHYGYSLPFKVIGHIVGAALNTGGAAVRSGAIEVVGHGVTGTGI